jgi:hypothetical protein
MTLASNLLPGPAAEKGDGRHGRCGGAAGSLGLQRLVQHHALVGRRGRWGRCSVLVSGGWGVVLGRRRVRLWRGLHTRGRERKRRVSHDARDAGLCDARTWTLAGWWV